MSLEELRKTVINKAKLEAEEIVREALEKARNIIKEAEEKKKAMIEEERRKLLSELELEAKLAEARREARLIVAKAKHEVVEEIRGKIKILLENMDEDKRRKSLRKLLLESLEELKNCGFKVENIVLYVSPRDKGIVENLLRELNINGKIVENSGIIGGLLISTPGNEVSIDNTYSSRVEKILRAVLPEILKGW